MVAPPGLEFRIPKLKPQNESAIAMRRIPPSLRPRTRVQLETSLCRALISMRYAHMKPAMEESWGLGP